MRKSVEKSTDFFIFMWLFNCILTETVPSVFYILPAILRYSFGVSPVYSLNVSRK